MNFDVKRGIVGGAIDWRHRFIVRLGLNHLVMGLCFYGIL